MSKQYSLECNGETIINNIYLDNVHSLIDITLNDILRMSKLEPGQVFDKEFKIKSEGRVVDELYKSRRSKFFVKIKCTA